jgi:hypothetical protein
MWERWLAFWNRERAIAVTWCALAGWVLLFLLLLPVGLCQDWRAGGWAAYAAVAVVGVSIAGAAFQGFQQRELRHHITLTHRPWVLVDSVEFWIDGVSSQLTVRIRNFGNIPTTKVVLRSRWETLGVEKFRLDEDTGRPPERAEVVTAGRQVEALFVLPNGKDDRHEVLHGAEQWLHGRSFTPRWVRVFGVIEYFGAAGDTRETRFSLTGPLKPDGRRRVANDHFMPIPPAENSAT